MLRVLTIAFVATLAATKPAVVHAERSAATAVTGDPAQLCAAAAAQAARETGVPLGVLRAISLTETGRQRDGALKPWPWTVNMEGAGAWFDTRDEALSFVFQHHQRGARSFDVGCFQLNYRWHGQGFASIEEMFDPLANARYAARFLTDLHAETGSWSEAAGAYHSRTPKYAERYRARFDRILANLGEAPPPAAELPPLGETEAEPVIVADAQPRVNSFPLLRSAAAPAGLGSLVPLGTDPARRLIEPTAVPQFGESG